MLETVKRRRREHWRRLAQESLTGSVPIPGFCARLNGRVRDDLGGTVESVREHVMNDLVALNYGERRAA